MMNTYPLPVVIEPPSEQENRIKRTGESRSASFITQLVVNTDAKLRCVIGRVDVADTRQRAYGMTIDNQSLCTKPPIPRVLSQA